MARYEPLPIYKRAIDLTIYFEKIVRNFSRYHKYTLAELLILAMIEPVETHFLWRPRLRDPADEMVLEAAVNGRAMTTARYPMILALRCCYPGTC